MLCAEDNPAFQPAMVHPDRMDYWNAQAPGGVPVPIIQAGTGPNPLAPWHTGGDG
jgi:hypothetical protein